MAIEEINVNAGTSISEESLKEVQKGAFYSNLIKSNRDIRASRAASLTEDLEFAYRTKIEILRRSIREKKRNLEDSLDLYPTSTTSLELAKNFDAQAFVDRDLKTSVDIRNLTIELAIAEERYKYLTGLSI